VPLLDELLAPLRAGNRASTQQPTPRITQQEAPAPEGREKMISQIPPKSAAESTRAIRGEPVLRPSDLARYLESGSGAKGTRTPDPLLANNSQGVSRRVSPQVSVRRVPAGPLTSGPVAVLLCCTFHRVRGLTRSLAPVARQAITSAPGWRIEAPGRWPGAGRRLAVRSPVPRRVPRRQSHKP
jgi:hypothetical protein